MSSPMSLHRVLRLSGWFFLVLSGAAFAPLQAQSLLIDFNSAPYPTNAPNNFLNAGPAQTFTVPGIYSLSGGVVLGNPTFLPSFTTNNGGYPPNLYGTADFTNPTLSSNVVLQLNSGMGIYHVTGVLFNGQPIAEFYSVDAYSGSKLVYSAGGLIPADTGTNGFLNFNLVSDVEPITSVVFYTPNATLNGWDFFIDSVNITGTAVPEPQPWFLLGTAYCS